MRFGRSRKRRDARDPEPEGDHTVATCAACMSVIEEALDGPDVLVLERNEPTSRTAPKGTWLPTLPFYFHARHAPHLNDQWRVISPDEFS